MYNVIGPETEEVLKFLPALLKNEIVQTSLFFLLAAWFHSGRVKEEISKHFTGLTTAINNVAESFKVEMSKRDKRMARYEKRLKRLENNNPLVNSSNLNQ